MVISILPEFIDSDSGYTDSPELTWMHTNLSNFVNDLLYGAGDSGF